MPPALPVDRFLTELHKMFERTKGAGAVTLTTKRSEWRGGEGGRRSARHPRAHALPMPHSANLKPRKSRKPDPVRERVREARWRRDGRRSTASHPPTLPPSLRPPSVCAWCGRRTASARSRPRCVWRESGVVVAGRLGVARRPSVEAALSLVQVTAKEHARFTESYGTILKAHMDGLKRREKKKK